MIIAETITKPLRIVDLRQCLLCNTCEKSCARRHKYQRNVREGIKIGHYIIPYACKQCESPQCVTSCKKGASTKDPVTGAVCLDRELCIGCGLCSKKCPFNSITMEESGRFKESKDKEGNIKKIPVRYANRCDLCCDYTKQGCFTNCPGGALKMLPFNEVLASLPPRHKEKLIALFINDSWISSDKKKSLSSIETL